MITRLRQKIEFNSKNPKYLQTIRGSGYVLWIE
jgi:two-component system phosphate regulon response regulator OmpR